MSSSTVRSAARAMSRAVMFNEAKLNYDKKLEFSPITALAELYKFDDTTPDQLLERVGDSEILITKEMQVPGSVIDLLPPSVRLIAESGTGYNNIDIAAAKRRGITVCNIPTYSTEAMAHIAITLMMNLSCSLVPQQRKVWEGDREGWRTLGPLPHSELTGKTLGLVGGRGTIGSKVTDIALVLGMRVLISSRSTAPSGQDNVEVVPMATLLQESDFVSIHCPLTDSTRGLIGMAELQQMKRTAYLINTARGAICKEAELAEALRTGVIAGAALDVHEVEPLPTDSPLFELANTLPNLILTPHIGWQRLETRQRMIDCVAANCAAFLDGKPQNVVS